MGKCERKKKRWHEVFEGLKSRGKKEGARSGKEDELGLKRGRFQMPLNAFFFCSRVHNKEGSGHNKPIIASPHDGVFGAGVLRARHC